MSKTKRDPRPAPPDTDAGPTDLDEDTLEDISGGPARRIEPFGDAIGNYDFKLEIDGVDAGQVTGLRRPGGDTKR